MVTEQKFRGIETLLELLFIKEGRYIERWRTRWRKKDGERKMENERASGELKRE